ncbi:MAG: HipA domain-containing protein, partial [Chitinophagaceae bacterium]
PLDEFSGQEFNTSCSIKIFVHPAAPILPYSENDFESLAKEVLESQTTITGVQAKLSLHITDDINKERKRFTIVGLWGGYILKPPSVFFPKLPEVEHLTMQLAKIAKIKTVPNSLIRLESGKLAFITKRVDRYKKEKLAMEDMCQLTERLTEEKYQGSYEQIGKAILKYSSTPGLDIINFFELIIFCFLTGNADMHLKNFSLLENKKIGMTLSPAYDLINTKLVNPSDKEEMALTLNGKKRKLKKEDFTKAMLSLNIDAIQQANIINKLIKCKTKWESAIENSFLSVDFKKQYFSIINEKMQLFTSN